MKRLGARSLRGLYAIVDPAACAGRDPVGVARAILRGGCAVLQLRDKHASDRALVRSAREMLAACRDAGVPFVVDDRLDVAMAIGADGVHLGQDDLPLSDARAIAGDLVIGVSTHDLDQLAAASEGGADLVGFGPVFSTGTKALPDPVVGLEGLRDAVAASRVPVVAIGGLDLARGALAFAAGAPLVAAISAVCGAADPESAARALHAVTGGGRIS